MKTMIGWAVLLLGLSCASVHAQAVFKCVVGGVVTYQQSPCEAQPALASRPGAQAPNVPLIGVWKSDHALTMDWLHKHTTMTPKQAAFLDQLEGHMTLTFTRDRLTSDMPSIDMTIEGKPRHMDGFRDIANYLVVASGPQRVSISNVNHATGLPMVSEFNFDGPDTMWTPMGGIGSPLDPKSREYFRRVK
jgi:hypothetical protein